ncbi:MAG TPA: hypothetical protein VLJ84_03905, partial [Usitatibacter sp.]|nr:hypothetical protein [Usitatibacter sp.]
LAGTLIFASSVAFAFHCPKDMAAIDAALAKNPKLSAADMAKVKQLRAEGEVAHKAGKHQEAVDKLGEAMKILKVDNTGAPAK